MLGFNGGLMGKRRVPTIGAASGLWFQNEWSINYGSFWTPASLTTALWLDAADALTVTTSSGAVTQWNDKSGNARHFEQTTSGLRPTYTTAALNGFAVVDFNADYLTSTAATSTWTFLHSSTGSSIFLVAKAGTSSNPNAYYGIAGTNQGSSSQIGLSLTYDDTATSNNNITMFVGDGAFPRNVLNAANNVWTPNAYQIIGCVTDPGNAAVLSRSFIYMNGGTAIANNADSGAPTTSTASFNLTIGATGGDSALVGGIAEFIIVSGLVSTANRQTIEGYMAHKWGLAANLPSDHPYRSFAPTV